jgi:hypothetical protein
MVKADSVEKTVIIRGNERDGSISYAIKFCLENVQKRYLEKAMKVNA